LIILRLENWFDYWKSIFFLLRNLKKNPLSFQPPEEPKLKTSEENSLFKIREKPKKQEKAKKESQKPQEKSLKFGEPRIFTTHSFASPYSIKFTNFNSTRNIVDYFASLYPSLNNE
jgi:hypothetical protein